MAWTIPIGGSKIGQCHEVGLAMSVVTIGLDLAKSVFQVTASIKLVSPFFAASLLGPT